MDLHTEIQEIFFQALAGTQAGVLANASDEGHAASPAEQLELMMAMFQASQEACLRLAQEIDELKAQ